MLKNLFSISGLFFFLGIAICFSACSGSQNLGEEKSVQEIKDAAKIDNASIIRSPVTANEPADTVNVAKISFAESSYNFGEVKEGTIVTKAFEFTNTGKVPLLINNAKSTCGCTVPKWPKEPILPGGTGSISVRFDTKNKFKQQRKPITVMANTYPSNTVVYLEGFVVPKDEAVN